MMLAALVAAAYSVVPKLKSSGVDPDVVALTITLAGTALGVLLALFASDLYQDFGERYRLSQLYNAAKHELDAKLEELADNIRLSVIGAKPAVFRLPCLIDRICSDPTFQKYLSPTLREKIFSQFGSTALEGDMLVLDDCKEDPVAYREILLGVFAQLSFQRSFISAEKLYLVGLCGRRSIRKLWKEFNEEADALYEEWKNRDWTTEILDAQGNAVKPGMSVPAKGATFRIGPLRGESRSGPHTR